ncbi:MAG: hypothetical protein ACRDOK_22815 [Streptosporangiaceae bacterium]
MAAGDAAARDHGRDNLAAALVIPPRSSPRAAVRAAGGPAAAVA